MTKELVAVVLAGGIGKRFWPIGTDKNLFPFFGKTLFEQSVVRSLPKDVTRIVIVANKNNASFFQKFRFSMPHDVVIQSSAGGMADALLCAADKLRGVSILVVIADDLMQPSVLSSVVDTASATNAFGVLPGWKTNGYFPGGYLVVGAQGRITSIMEKPGVGKEPSPYVYVSGQYIRESDRLMQAIKQVSISHDDVYEQALTSLMKRETFIMAPYEGFFISLKYPWNVLDVMGHLLTEVTDYRGKNVEVKKNVVIEGTVWIGDNVKVFENTKMVGPCYIGDNTVIGNNNIIRGSYIGVGCVTGFNTDITRSYIGDNCWFHSNYIGDSVLEGNVSMGSGTVLANLRLDRGEIASVVRENRINTKRTKLGAMIGKNVALGVNTSIMPGVKIGHDSMVGAGLVVNRDIPDASKKLL